MNEHGLERVSRRFLRFADTECANGYAPHYDALSRSVAEDEQLLEFLLAQPSYQPNLLFAAVQYITGPELMPETALALRTVLADTRGQIPHLMRTKRTQTNEVGRAACLLPALPETPLALLEVGASAGLVLNLDRYSYDYGTYQLHEGGKPLLACAIYGEPRLPVALPEIRWRRGLDLQPVDLTNPDNVAWLLACVWPDHPERRERLEQAIAIAQETPVGVQPGDLTRDVGAFLANAPPDATMVVFHSAVLAYVERKKRRLLGEQLIRASRERPIVWLSNEVPGIVPELEPLARPQPEFRFLLGRTTLYDGERTDELLAYTHPHGNGMQWVGPRDNRD